MQITKRSIISGKIRTMDLDITRDQLRKWKNGDGLIQDIMSNLTSDEREFLITGITPEEWEATFKDESAPS